MSNDSDGAGEIFKSLLACLFILVEIGAGALLFFCVIWIERHLAGAAQGIDRSDAFLYWFVFGGRALLICADAVVILFFTVHGVVSAYKQLWKKG
jgi:hypothetical protein